MKVIITQGLPASGKSTWAKQFCKENKNWVRVNRDDLRNMRGEYWLPKQEDFITEIERVFIEKALQNELNVIVDATNLNPKYLESMKTFIGDKATIEYKKFPCEVEECIKRDLKRPDSVGEKVIRDMYNKYLSPTHVVYKEDKNLPKAIIVDIDGTLAKMNGRGPFEWDKVDTDHVKDPIRLIVNMIGQFHNVIIFSGRDGCCKDLTIQWLKTHNIRHDSIFMRPEGNNEKDSIIKKRLFEENIRGKYYIDFVLDDRNQVVDMWRKELGLVCLQVDYGDF
jgi:predicted kinase